MTRHEAERRVIEAARAVLAQYEPHEIVDAEAELRDALADLDALPADDGWRHLVEALRDHINNHMDQWELWRLTDSFGNPVYIKISHYPHDGADAAAYDDLDASPPDDGGRG